MATTAHGHWRGPGLKLGRLAVALALGVASCAGPGGGDRVTVLAAASLAGAFRALEGAARDAGLAPAYSFAGTQVLAAQVRQGAPADVIAGADAEHVERLAREGRLEGAPVVFARNRMVVVVPVSAGAAVTSARDLARPGVRVVLAGPAVPAGRSARDGLAALGILDAVLPHVVSNEDSVTGVAEKVALGEADAGVVYITDARADRRLRAVGAPLPVEAVDVVAVVRGAPHRQAARRFVALLGSPAGRDVLRRFGFEPA